MSSSNSAGTVDENIRLLVAGYQHINGTINFEALAQAEGAASTGALRKRFKRYFASKNMNVNIRGDRIGTDAASAANTPKKAAGNKRKSVAEVDDDNDDDVEADAAVEDTIQADAENDVDVSKTPKSAKATKPKTPKTPDTAKTPKTPKTPKVTAKTGVNSKGKRSVKKAKLEHEGEEATADSDAADDEDMQV